jgi:hypothetical protein
MLWCGVSVYCCAAVAERGGTLDPTIPDTEIEAKCPTRLIGWYLNSESVIETRGIDLGARVTDGVYGKSVVPRKSRQCISNIEAEWKYGLIMEASWCDFSNPQTAALPTIDAAAIARAVLYGGMPSKIHVTRLARQVTPVNPVRCPFCRKVNGVWRQRDVAV